MVQYMKEPLVVINNSKPVLVYGRRLLSTMLFYDAIGNEDFIIDSFVVDDQYKETEIFLGLKVISFSDVEKLKPKEEFDMIALDATLKPNSETLYSKGLKKGYKFRNYISKKSIVTQSVIMGENNIVFEQSYIGPEAELGSNNIIRQQVYLGHNLKMANNCVINSGVKIGGNCTIDSNCYLGLNSTVINDKHLRFSSIIGAGAVVIKDTQENSKNVGNPSKEVKSTNE